jgi:putative peptide zinc metalloprotease protein
VSDLMSINGNSLITIHEFSSLIVGEYVNVGRNDSDKFIKIPKVGLEFIKILDGKTISETEEIFIKKYNLDIDGIKFVEELIKAELIKSINGVQIPCSKVISSLSFLNSRNIGWLKSNITYGIIVCSIFLLAFLSYKEGLFSLLSWRNFFVSELYAVSGIFIIITQVILLFVHESAHLLVARSFDVSSRISIGFRAHFLVLQTTATGLWTVNKWGRIKFYLIGILSDLFIFFVSIYISGIVINSFLRDLLLLICINIILKIMWQFQVYLRTDIYFLLQEFAGVNLYHRSLKWLKNKLISIIKLKHFSSEESILIKIYGTIIFFGIFFSLIFSISIGIPITIELIYGSALQFYTGFTQKKYILVINGGIVILFEFLIAYLLVNQWYKYIKRHSKLSINNN